jgi:hypothetical protein
MAKKKPVNLYVGCNALLLTGFIVTLRALVEDIDEDEDATAADAQEQEKAMELIDIMQSLKKLTA